MLYKQVTGCRSQRQCYANTEVNIRDNINPAVVNKDDSKASYFLLGANEEAGRKACVKITLQLQKECQDVFSGVGCTDGTFSLQVKSDSKLYQAPPRHVVYMHFRSDSKRS